MGDISASYRRGNRIAVGRRGWPGWSWLFLLLLALPSQASEAMLEYQVKAAYLYNFLKFVQWPDDQFLDAVSPIRICILGDNPFHGMLDELRQRHVASRKLTVVQLEFEAELQQCHLVYIGGGQQGQIERALQRVRLFPVLTVSDMQDFAARGGVIGFVIIDERVRLEINLDVARAAGLQISAKLLELAKIIECAQPC